MKIFGFSELFRFEGFIIDTITCTEGFVQIALHRDRRRNAGYPNVVWKFCPNAEIIYDKFHIVKNLNEAVDQVRELLNILKFGMTNAAMERFNATVSKVIARGHGYRDLKYLVLKYTTNGKIFT